MTHYPCFCLGAGQSQLSGDRKVPLGHPLRDLEIIGASAISAGPDLQHQPRLEQPVELLGWQGAGEEEALADPALEVAQG